jgi:ribonuclease-3
VLGYRFGRREFLEQALTHRSHGSPNNERLEFLGDGVLGCVVAETLIARHPSMSEGDLSRLRASLVREATLASVAREAGLGALLRMGQGEDAAGGADRPSLLADALEAVYGAVFLDAGYDEARRVILRTLGPALEKGDLGGTAKDAKTRLQEVLQAQRQGLPRYVVVDTQGAAHRQVFEVECVAEGPGLRTRGRGSSRRAAEQQAAAAMLARLGA